MFTAPSPANFAWSRCGERAIWSASVGNRFDIEALWRVDAAIGVSVYLLVAILKKELGLPQSLHQILQIFSLTQFEKIPIFSMFAKKNYTFQNFNTYNLLTLSDL
jgi:hypothetical protein